MLEVQERTKGRVKLGPGTLYGAIERLLADEPIAEDAEKHARRSYPVGNRTLVDIHPDLKVRGFPNITI